MCGCRRSVAAEGTAETPEQRTDLLRASMEASRLLHEMPKPTIAMLNGVAAGSRDVAGAGMRSAHRRTQRADDHGVRQGRAVRRLRRHMVSDATCRHGARRANCISCPTCWMRRGSRRWGWPTAWWRTRSWRRRRWRWRSGWRTGQSVALRYMKRNLNVAECGTTGGWVGQRGVRDAALPCQRGPQGGGARFREKRAAGVQGAVGRFALHLQRLSP